MLLFSAGPMAQRRNERLRLLQTLFWLRVRGRIRKRSPGERAEQVDHLKRGNAYLRKVQDHRRKSVPYHRQVKERQRRALPRCILQFKKYF